eukprot:5181894-Prymnesium_polylepis.3
MPSSRSGRRPGWTNPSGGLGGPPVRSQPAPSSTTTNYVFGVRLTVRARIRVARSPLPRQSSEYFSLIAFVDG